MSHSWLQFDAGPPPLLCTCDGVISSDPHSWSVGHGRHGGLFALLLLPVDDEEEEKKEHQQQQDNDSCDGPNLVGVHLHGCTGQTVEAANHHTGCRQENIEPELRVIGSKLTFISFFKIKLDKVDVFQ